MDEKIHKIHTDCMS